MGGRREVANIVMKYSLFSDILKNIFMFGEIYNEWNFTFNVGSSSILIQY
jgi:hypothetical protein